MKTEKNATMRTPKSKSARKEANPDKVVGDTPKVQKSKKSAKKNAKPDNVDGEVTRCEGILCPAATDNLYYIAHDAADALRLRGFRWRKLKKGRKKAKAR